MSQGIILLIVMALFFGAMYGYAYITTDYRDRVNQRARAQKLKERQMRFQKIKAAMKQGRESIKEKYAKAEQRSIEIKNELKSLGSQNVDPIA